jgi:hypothetical protein
LNALINAYSARPSLRGMASKLPIQPLSLGGWPARDDLVFHVTNNGLENHNYSTHLDRSVRSTYYFSSTKLGEIGSLDVSAQYNASKA